MVSESVLVAAVSEARVLRHERDAALRQVDRLREALERCGRLDKTEYDYPSARDRALVAKGKTPRRVVLNPRGELPPGGQRWQTPAEVASDALRPYRMAAARGANQNTEEDR